MKPSQVKVYSSRRQESHLQRRRATGAGAGARGCGSHHPPVSRKSPARDESSFGCVVRTRQFFVRFLFEVCWVLSFFSPEVPVLGELVRARGFRSRAFNSALARLAGCHEADVQIVGLEHMKSSCCKSGVRGTHESRARVRRRGFWGAGVSGRVLRVLHRGQ